MRRGTGETTRQMQVLPIGGLFIWCNQQLDYPKRLAWSIGRDDIEVVSPMYVLDQRWRGMVYTGVAIDHAYIYLNPYNPVFWKYYSLLRVK